MDELFGGTLVKGTELLETIRERIKALAKFQDEEIQSAIRIGTSYYKRERPMGLTLPKDTLIKEDVLIDHETKWIWQNGINLIYCPGDLTVEGDFTASYNNHAPLLVVEGNPKVRNLFSDGFCFIVLGDLIASGYFIEKDMGGLVRIAGKLQAKGYVPRSADWPEFKGHIVNQVDAVTFDARARPGIKEYKLFFSKDALKGGYLDIEKVRKLEHKGLTIFRDPEDSKLDPAPPPPPPLPELNEAEARSAGELKPASDANNEISKIIRTELSRRSRSADAYSEWIGYWLENPKDQDNVLYVPPNTTLAGDIVLDWETSWLAKDRVRIIACLGDLHIKGDLLNWNLDGGPILFVAGSLYVNNVIKGGAPLLIMDNLVAKGIVVCEYNHGVTNIGGNVSAKAMLVMDHSVDIDGAVNCVYLHDWDMVKWRKYLVPEVFENEDDESPSAKLLWAQERAGLSVFRSDAPTPPVRGSGEGDFYEDEDEDDADKDADDNDDDD